MSHPLSPNPITTASLTALVPGLVAAGFLEDVAEAFLTVEDVDFLLDVEEAFLVDVEEAFLVEETTLEVELDFLVVVVFLVVEAGLDVAETFDVVLEVVFGVLVGLLEVEGFDEVFGPYVATASVA